MNVIRCDRYPLRECSNFDSIDDLELALRLRQERNWANFPPEPRTGRGVITPLKNGYRRIRSVRAEDDSFRSVADDDMIRDERGARGHVDHADRLRVAVGLPVVSNVV